MPVWPTIAPWEGLQTTVVNRDFFVLELRKTLLIQSHCIYLFALQYYYIHQKLEIKNNKVLFLSFYRYFNEVLCGPYLPTPLQRR